MPLNFLHLSGIVEYINQIILQIGTEPTQFFEHWNNFTWIRKTENSNRCWKKINRLELLQVYKTEFQFHKAEIILVVIKFETF